MTTAQAWAIRAALPFLRKSEHPRIINVTSTEAHGATRFNSAYVVAKHASLGLTRAMAVELGKEGITVNCVCPGPVRTGITDAIPEKAKQTFANRRTALRRYAESEEVAHATLSLVLPAASFITGAKLRSFHPRSSARIIMMLGGRLPGVRPSGSAHISHAIS